MGRAPSTCAHTQKPPQPQPGAGPVGVQGLTGGSGEGSSEGTRPQESDADAGLWVSHSLWLSFWPSFFSPHRCLSVSGTLHLSLPFLIHACAYVSPPLSSTSSPLLCAHAGSQLPPPLPQPFPPTPFSFSSSTSLSHPSLSLTPPSSLFLSSPPSTHAPISLCLEPPSVPCSSVSVTSLSSRLPLKRKV